MMQTRTVLHFPAPRTSGAVDEFRRWANLLLAIGQIAVTVACFSFGTTFDDATGTARNPDPPIVPASYAFIVWAPIYFGCLVYGIYQFMPSRRTDLMLRRIGLFTASAFLACCAWLVAARTGHLHATVPIIYWMAGSVFGAFIPLWRLRGVAAAFRWCVVAPISIYAGWLSVAIFANTAAENSHTLLGQRAGSIALILAAAALATIVVRRSAGNLFYAGTIAWALVGIGVRNQFELKQASVAAAAWLCLIAFAAMTAWLGRAGVGAQRRVSA